MFFYDVKKHVLILSGGCWGRPEAVEASPGLLDRSGITRNAVGMLGHVFDHQAPLTRPLEAVVAACSTLKAEMGAV